MLNFVTENRAPFLAVTLLLGFLFLLSFQIRVPAAADRIEGAFLTVVSPVVQVSSGAVDGAGGLWQGYVDLRNLREENQRLSGEVATLRMERQRLEEAAREGLRLADLLGLKQAGIPPSVAARVILLELSDPFRVAVLDRGANDGVTLDAPVITPAGVVGRITAVSGTASKVQLIVDPSSGAAAMVSRSRLQGMVVGRGVNELEMQYLSSLADVRPGDSIDTSGLDGLYPKGFRIGKVVAVAAADRLQQHLAVETAVDFRTLEEVLVLIGGVGTPGAADDLPVQAESEPVTPVARDGGGR